MLIPIPAADALARLAEFDSVIDARSESEFAEDRLPGAVNWPSLTDEERRAVGTEYAQISPFVAKKRGAVLVARNIAAHIEREVLDKPKDWRPLVYCWRGGSRSNALATVLSQIGFRVHLVEGGYQRYRNAVLSALDTLPAQLRYRVICGPTGSGKSRLLQALQARGAQVLDLEALANHRGSVLGLVPGERQPGQKQFESRIWAALSAFDASLPVIVESESSKVGDLRVPLALIECMRKSPCVQFELGLEARVALLIEDYDFFVHDTTAFCSRLDALRATRGHATVNAWQLAARAGRTADVVRDLLVAHYDPGYAASIRRNFAGMAAPEVIGWNGDGASLDAAAERVLSLHG